MANVINFVNKVGAIIGCDLYMESETEPKMISLGLHDRRIGRPVRAAGLVCVLD